MVKNVNGCFLNPTVPSYNAFLLVHYPKILSLLSQRSRNQKISIFKELESHHFQIVFIVCDLLTSAKRLPTDATNRRYLLDTSPVRCQRWCLTVREECDRRLRWVCNGKHAAVAWSHFRSLGKNKNKKSWRHTSICCCLHYLLALRLRVTRGDHLAVMRF